MRLLLIMSALLMPGGGVPPSATMMMAAPIGVRAPDTVDGRPGNPFATAFIEVLGDQRAHLAELSERLKSRTHEISKGALSPDISEITGDPLVRLGGAGPGERRVALVVVHSAYTRGWPTLAGAAVDAERVGLALRRAGFETQTIVDPGRTRRAEALKWLVQASSGADVAVLYATGHGMMFEERGYLLDSDFARGWREDQLAEHAINIEELGIALRAKRANLLLFGGCRSYEWWQ